MATYKQERLFLYREPEPQPQNQAQTVEDWITVTLNEIILARTPTGQIDNDRIHKALEALPTTIRGQFNSLVHERLKR